MADYSTAIDWSNETLPQESGGGIQTFQGLATFRAAGLNVSAAVGQFKIGLIAHSRAPLLTQVFHSREIYGRLP